MSAMVATPYTASNPCQYPDLGAINHLTPNINNLMTKVDYNGHEKIHTGNGEGLSISHIAYSSFSSPFTAKIS